MPGSKKIKLMRILEPDFEEAGRPSHHPLNNIKAFQSLAVNVIILTLISPDITSDEPVHGDHQTE